MADSESYSRETILTFSLVALALAFTVAGTASRLYHDQQTSMAQQWYQRGNAELDAGHATEAVEDFSNSVVYARDNDLFALRLAQAFIAAGRPQEAQAHLEELWERAPSSGIVNLELARLAARNGDVSGTVRSYNNAIYGVWDGTEQQEKRRSAEFELYGFLMSQGQKPQAEAELMAIASALPADPTLHIQVGKLMLSDGDFTHALSEFRAALEADPAQPEALADAGKAAFELGDYPAAVRYLEQAIRNKTSDPMAAQILETSRAALSLDPFDTRLGNSDNSRRASRALALAITRIDSCTGQGIENAAATPPADLQDLYSQARKIQAQGTPAYLQSHPEGIEPLMELVASLEAAALKICGESPEAADRALLLIAHRHGSSQP